MVKRTTHNLLEILEQLTVFPNCALGWVGDDKDNLWGKRLTVPRLLTEVFLERGGGGGGGEGQKRKDSFSSQKTLSLRCTFLSVPKSLERHSSYNLQGLTELQFGELSSVFKHRYYKYY